MSGCEDAALRSTTLFSAAIDMAASVTDEQMSPITTLTLSAVISFRSPEMPAAGWHWLSAGTIWIGRPSTPPAAFSSSAASPAPFWAKPPHRARLPVIGVRRPILIGSPLGCASTQGIVTSSAITAATPHGVTLVSLIIVPSIDGLRRRVRDDALAHVAGQEP